MPERPPPFPSRSRRLPASPRTRSGAAGFTLSELLLASALGLVLMGALVSMIVSHVRSRNRMETLLRLQDQWTRVQFLIDQDIQESRPPAAGVQGCGSGDRRLVLEVPGFNNRITYYLVGTDLWRCGPTIDANGTLVDTPSDALMVRGVSRFEVNLDDPQRPSYLLSLRDSTGIEYTNRREPSGATSRSRVIN